MTKTISERLRDRAHEKLEQDLNKVFAPFILGLEQLSPQAVIENAVVSITSNYGEQRHSAKAVIDAVRQAVYELLRERYEEVEIDDFIANVDKKA